MLTSLDNRGCGAARWAGSRLMARPGPSGWDWAAVAVAVDMDDQH
jgi:hypothetical protein